MTQACLSPKLAGALEAPLPPGTGRFDGTAADGPAAPEKLPIVHPTAVTGKIVLLPTDDFCAGSTPNRQSRQAFEHLLVLPVLQIVALLIHPPLPPG